MEQRTFQTPQGEVWLWGSTEAFEGHRAVVLVVQGLFGNQGQRWLPLEERLGVSVLIANLPGFDCPSLSGTSLATIADAYSRAATFAFRGRRGLICGESMGGVVALAMTVARTHRVAFDPPLRSSGLGPILSDLRAQLAIAPQHAPLLWDLGGVSTDTVEERDYTYLLDRTARIIAGSTAGDPPSVVRDDERALMLSLPHIWFSVAAPAGHILPPDGAPHLIAALRSLLGGAQQQDQHATRAAVA